MARPTKQGIDYFPIDCQFDDKIEMYLIEKGAPGFAVLVSLWQMIYSNEGYYILNNKDLHLLIKRKIDVDVNEVNSCINVCLGRNLFSQELHNKYTILSSKAIQKRYFEAAKKKKNVNILVDYIINGIDSYDNWVYVGGNATNVNVNVKEDVKEEGTRTKTEFILPEKINTQAWLEFLEHRTQIKKPMSSLAKTKSVNILLKLTFENQQSCVDYSIAGRYQGLFPDKFTTDRGNGNGTHTENRSKGFERGDKIGDDWLAENQAKRERQIN